MRYKVTINDVAKMAEVSVATVSYVLNKNPKKTISVETSKRVMEAAKQLNYISNSAAKTLQSSRTNCIGVVLFQSLILPRHAQAMQGVIDTLKEHSYNIMFCSTKITQNGYPDYLNTYFAHKIDGIVYLGADSSALEPEIENVIVEQRIPFVACDCETNRNISSIVIDYFKGAYDMVKSIIEKGAKKILFARPDSDNRQEREREQGVRRAVYEHPDVQLEILTLELGGNRQHFFEFYRASLYEHKDQLDADTALICSWSGMDQHSLIVLGELGLTIPIATLAQGTLSNELFPNLFYSYLPNLLIGATCAHSILRLLDDESDIRHEIVQPTLTQLGQM